MVKKKKTGQSKQTPVRKFFRVLGKIILIIFIISILLPLAYRWVNPPFTPLMVIRKVQNGTPIEKEWRDIDQISRHMVSCAIASEDNNFLSHRGFDWRAIQRAIDEHKTRGRNRGASTISQQTAKNVFLWPGHSWIRKGAEVYFTFLIETFWSKERIMEVYLNVIEMGDGIYGAEAAAQHYFHKSAAKLNLYQSALITACYPAPLKRNPAKPSGYLCRRAGQISALTYKFGRISFDEEYIKRAKERYAKRKMEWYEIEF